MCGYFSVWVAVMAGSLTPRYMLKNVWLVSGSVTVLARSLLSHNMSAEKPLSHNVNTEKLCAAITPN